MDKSRFDLRQRQVGEGKTSNRFGFMPKVVGVTSFGHLAASTDGMLVSEQAGDDLAGERVPCAAHRHSTSFGEVNDESSVEPTTVFLFRGGGSCVSGSAVLPSLRDSRPLTRHDAHSHFTDERNPELVSNAMQIQGGYGDDPYWQVLSEEAGGSWNSLGHRRVHSAPNIMERMGELSGPAASRVGDLGLLMPCSDLLEPDVVDRTIPEGRRYQALEPPLRSSATDRPRSWRVRSAAPPWGAGSDAVQELVAREHGEWTPKLRASYFVDVRSPREDEAARKKFGASGEAGDGSEMKMSTGARPFEEIKRMRLSQALDSGPPEAISAGMAPSPTFATCARASFEGARSSLRFSPGNGVAVSAFKAAAGNGRPLVGAGGMREIMGFTRQPVSPALTAPPTPPPSRLDWKVHDSDVGGARSLHGGVDGAAHGQASASEADQVVLPMEKRPPDEVNAVQALMSVGRGARTQPTQASVPEESNNVSMDAGEIVELPPSFTSGHTHIPLEMSQTSDPSDERSKLSSGGDEDDDDGLDKDLWVVVEKGSICSTADCVYRDPAARIASRRHYHSNCTHTHNGGVKKGMVFHHHQLEKVQKHQRSHQREATKSAPYKRTTPEDHQAMEGAGVEGYRPEDWKPEETRQLKELVNQLVAPVTHAWPSIARFFPTKSSIQCLLHWRFTLNDNGIIRGNGTWGAEEDARLRKLAPIFSSPSTGPRWAKIAEVMPGRTAKQCRERYNNHVDPAIKKDKVWTEEEDELVMRLHAEHHNQFAKIARRIPGRCYDDVKNRSDMDSYPPNMMEAPAEDRSAMMHDESLEAVASSSEDDDEDAEVATRKGGLKRPTPEFSRNEVGDC